MTSVLIRKFFAKRLEEGFVRERDRAAVAEDTALGMQAQVDEFVDQYAESSKRIIDRECSDVKKHGRDLVENVEVLAWHEENVVMELRRELQQARLQVSSG